MTTFLSVFLPLFYLGAATQFARYVSHTTRADTEDERFMHAIMIGIFWPLTIPFYIALHESPERNWERKIEKAETLQHFQRMAHRSLTKGRDE